MRLKKVRISMVVQTRKASKTMAKMIEKTRVRAYDKVRKYFWVECASLDDVLALATPLKNGGGMIDYDAGGVHVGWYETEPGRKTWYLINAITRKTIRGRKHQIESAWACAVHDGYADDPSCDCGCRSRGQRPCTTPGCRYYRSGDIDWVLETDEDVQLEVPVVDTTGTKKAKTDRSAAAKKAWETIRARRAAAQATA